MTFQESLLNWYQLNQRSLPFRENKDPYRIWVSEVMLQQTQIATMLPYYDKFMKKFPTVFHLAKASEDEVYKIWAGLGYYSRAKNLLKCAKELVKNYDGIFPKDYKKALGLPGVGPYTAGAVLSIAYNLKYPAVDGNVMRVISRLFNIRDDLSISKSKKVFEEKVQSILPDDVRNFNQALMELGALICTPQNPACPKCPIHYDCEAYKQNIQDQLPVKTKKIKNKKFSTAVAMIKNKDRILFINHRQGLLSGLWGLPLVESQTQVKAKKLLLEEIEGKYPFTIIDIKKLGTEIHIFTHKTWNMTIYEININLDQDFCVKESSTSDIKLAWLKAEDLHQYAISTAFQKVINQFILS